jgi:hypothetical protein
MPPKFKVGDPVILKPAVRQNVPGLIATVSASIASRTLMRSTSGSRGKAN